MATDEKIDLMEINLETILEESDVNFSNGRLAEALGDYRAILGQSHAPLELRSRIYDQIAQLCARVGDYTRARTFLNLAIFANPLDRSLYRKRIALAEKGEIPFRTFCVVFATYNRYQRLVQCIHDIRQNSYYPVKIIVVSDPCDDGTEEFLKAESARPDFIGIVNTEHCGCIPSLCRGLEYLQGDYVCLCSDDVTLMPGWDLEVVLSVDADPSIGCAVPLVLNSKGGVQSAGQHNDFWSDKYQWLGCVEKMDHTALLDKNLLEFPDFQKARPCDYGFFPVLKIDHFRRCGMVDANYRQYYADPDLGYAVQKHGWQNMYCPTSVFVHHQDTQEITYKKKTKEISLPDALYFRDKWGIHNLSR